MKKNEEVNVEYGFRKDGLGLTIETMFSGMESLLQSKTVVGEQITVGDAKIVPLIEVSAGMATGAFGKNTANNGAGAMSAKMSPVALLVMQGDRVRLINVKDQDIVSKIVDLIPDAIDKITGKRVSPEVVEKAKEIAGNFGVKITKETAAEEDSAEKEEDIQ